MVHAARPLERIDARVLCASVGHHVPAWGFLLAAGLPPGVDSDHDRLPPEPGRELLTDTAFTWRAGRNYVRLPPGKSHVIKVQPG